MDVTYVIGGGHRWRRVNMVSRLCDLGMVVLLIFKSEEYDFDVWRGKADIVFLDNGEDGEVTKISVLLNTKYNNWLCVPLDDYYCRFMVLLSHLSTNPIMDVAGYNTLKDKVLFRSYLSQFSSSMVTPIAFAEVNKNFDIHRVEFRYPVILKPVSLDGGTLVSLCCDKEQLVSEIDFAKAQIEFLKETGRSFDIEISNRLMIEEYVVPDNDHLSDFSGNYTIHLLVRKGDIQVVGLAKHVKQGIHSTSYIFIPKTFWNQRIRTAIQYAIAILEPLNMFNTYLNMEFVLDEAKFFPIECNPRISGDFIPETLEDIMGIHPIAALGSSKQDIPACNSFIYHNLYKFSKYIADAHKHANFKMLYENEFNVISERLNLNKSSIMASGPAEVMLDNLGRRDIGFDVTLSNEKLPGLKQYAYV